MLKRQNDVDYTPQGSDALDITPDSEQNYNQVTTRSTEETDLESNIKNTMGAFDEIDNPDKTVFSQFVKYLNRVSSIDKQYSRKV